LIDCLTKHLSATGAPQIAELMENVGDKEMQQQLRVHFVKINQDKFGEISAAIAGGDLKLAHRLVHSLKSNAGQIGEKLLEQAAATVETVLSDGETLPEQTQLETLGRELRSVLEKLAPMLIMVNEPSEPPDEEKIRNLFKKLEPMLVNRNPACISLIDDIRKIPGTDELVKQIESLKFKQAAIVLAELKEGRVE